MKKFGIAILVALGALFSLSANAGEGYFGPASIDFISVVSDVGGHKPGNLEIGIAGGFTLPAGVSCSNQYITTLRSVVNYDSMLEVLLAGYINNKQFLIGITDDPSKTAYAGRCSLTFVNLQ